MRLGLHSIEKIIPSSTWVFDLVPIELNPQVCFEFQQGTCGIYYIYSFMDMLGISTAPALFCTK